MGIPLSSNFDVNVQLPIDSRFVVDDLTARDALSAIQRYEGLIVYVEAEIKNYQLQGGIANTDWVEVGGAGGGGTKTKWDGNLASNASTIITHPAVSLSEPEKISAFAWWLMNGESYGNENIQFDMSTIKDDDYYWDIPDLNTGGATWIDEGGVTGHFSIAAGDISKYCQIRINGITYIITIIVGDGTGIGAVTHDGGAIGGNYSITWIRGVNYAQGCVSIAAANGVANPGFWRIAKSSVNNMLTPSQKAVAGVFGSNAISGTQATTGNGRLKMAVSIDNGVTWQYYDGTDWQTMLETEFATKGMEYLSWAWKGSDGLSMTGHWDEISADLSTADIRLMFASYAPTDADYSYVQSLTMKIHEKDTPHLLPFNISNNIYVIMFKRISTTEIIATNKSNSAMNNLNVIIETP